MIVEQFERHRRQWTGAADPIRPHRAFEACGPTFVSEPDRFRGHGSDLWRYFSATIICIQGRFRPKTFISQVFWKNFNDLFRSCSPWLIWAVVWVELWAPDWFWGGHAPDVTGPVTWLQQLDTRSTTNGKEPAWEMQSDWPGRIQGLTGRTWVKGFKEKSLEEQNLLWKRGWTVVPTFSITFEMWFYNQVYWEQTEQNIYFKEQRNLKISCFRFLLPSFLGALKWDRVSLWLLFDIELICINWSNFYWSFREYIYWNQLIKFILISTSIGAKWTFWTLPPRIENHNASFSTPPPQVCIITFSSSIMNMINHCTMRKL